MIPFTVLKSQRSAYERYSTNEEFQVYDIELPKDENIENVDLTFMCDALEAHFNLCVGAFNSKDENIDLFYVKYGDKWFSKIAKNMYVLYEISQQHTVFSNFFLIRDDSE